MTLSVVMQLPAYRTPEMLPTLERWAAQPVPDDVDLERELWVTLSPQNRELCTTWQAAIRSRAFEPREAPPGRLSARTEAHNAAAEAGADVIVVASPMAPPLRDDALTALLAPFQSDDPPAAVAGSVRGGFLNSLSAPRARLPAQLSAFSAEAWNEAGPFVQIVNEQDERAVRYEEEVAFRQRVEDVGLVVDSADAQVRNDRSPLRDSVNRAFDRFGHYPRDDWLEPGTAE